jgi:uncharacterized protein YcfJ
MNKRVGRTTVVAALGALLGAPAALAGHERGWEYAQVVRAEPVYREVRVTEPSRECREAPVTERVHYRGHSDPGAVLLGGVIGGVIGHQFGGGSGRDIATAAGAVIGAHHAASRTYAPARTVERTVYERTCSTVHRTRYEERVDGYDVTYRWHGRLYRTHLPYDPGKRVRVRMDVTGAGD